MQSTLITFDYPSFNIKTKYSVQPIFAERAYNTIYHYHVFPNFKLMRFNRLTLQNDPSFPIYSGLISQVLASPTPGEEDFIFIVEDNRVVRKI